MALNRYQFTGNIGKDAEVRTLENGSIAISFTVAVSEKYKDRQGNEQTNTTWVNCTRWVVAGGSTAIAPHLKKGTKVLVEGKPTARAYNTNSGEVAASLEVRVDTIELLGQPQQQGASGQQAAPQAQPQPYPQTQHRSQAPQPQYQQAAPHQFSQSTPFGVPSDSLDDLPF